VRVAYYITHFPYAEQSVSGTQRYACGGAEWAAYNLAINVARHGHDVKVFTASIDSRDAIEHRDGITICRYGTSFSVESSSVSLGILCKPSKYAADVVHTHFTVPPASYAALCHAKRKKAPFVLTYHSEQRSGYGTPIRRLGAMIDSLIVRKSLLPSAKVIISPSAHYAAESVFLKSHKDKVVSIPNGVNLEEFDVHYSKEECRRRLELPQAAKIVLFVGSLSPQKAPDVLMKAVPMILESAPDALLLIVGDGIMRQQLEQLMRDLDVRRSVRFAGHVDRNSISLYYKASDVFVLPSIEETFGIVLLEASASGLPMVVSDLPTFRWIIKDGYNGLVVARGDETGLAHAVTRLLRDDQLRSMMGQNARGQAANYSWPAVAEETERLYVRVLEAT
jgi:glycosyltransferase involved in cell wall biosynthesis